MSGTTRDNEWQRMIFLVELNPEVERVSQKLKILFAKFMG